MNLRKLGRCSFEQCKNKASSKGLCTTHYCQQYNNKELTEIKPRKKRVKECTIENCNEKHYAKGMCSFHYYQKYNTTIERIPYLKDVRKKYFRTEKGKAALKKGSQKRRARKKNSVVKDFLSKDIFERDNYICSICALPIDKSLAYPNPNSITLEHIIPLSKGGSHSPENVTCAHWICNVRRGNRPLKNNFEGASI